MNKEQANSHVDHSLGFRQAAGNWVHQTPYAYEYKCGQLKHECFGVRNKIDSEEPYMFP